MYNTTKLSFSNNHLLLSSINTFVGLTSFTFSNQNVFSLSTSIGDEHSFSVSSSSKFDQLTMTYIIASCDYCSYKSPSMSLLQDSLMRLVPAYNQKCIISLQLLFLFSNIRYERMLSVSKTTIILRYSNSLFFWFSFNSYSYNIYCALHNKSQS